MTYEQALSQSTTIAQVKIVEAGKLSDHQLGRERDYSVEVLSVEKGKLSLGTHNITFFLPRARRDKDGTMICPFLPGSGIEEELKLGQRYRVLLIDHKQNLQLLWAMSEQKEDRAVAY